MPPQFIYFTFLELHTYLINAFARFVFLLISVLIGILYKYTWVEFRSLRIKLEV